MKMFWRWLALFAYRRWARLESPGRMPVGVPGHRDPGDRCASYAPRRRELGDWADCQTDGHYLCRGCAHREIVDIEETMRG